ncbi:hypothetical protein [Streptomyces sp. NPDC056683]|uniref:hypothetical protein n=1 Tax=Streptomyces sp. NPDC056683 TaxID=3345910 RepID=UPI0036C43ADD
MNQVERWFGLLTDKLIRRGVHTSVKALEADISLADCLTKAGTTAQKTEQNQPSGFLAHHTS